ncbi:MAG: flavin reductase family protein [Dehalococcoidia bacterium]|nr:flavin reductase family protein [Dehalococcoidia bacterium]
MAISQDVFKAVLSRFASGVTIISAYDNGRLAGATASAFCSLSLNPPLVLVCLDLKSNTKAIIDRTRVFGVNILQDTQRAASDLFARKVMTEEQLAKIGHTASPHGMPILDDALAFLECRVYAVYPGGDHEIYVGEVLDGGIRQGRPLLYYQGKYRRMGAEM